MSGVGRPTKHHDQPRTSTSISSSGFYYRTLVLSLFCILLAWILPTDTGSSVVPPRGGGGGASASTTLDELSSSSYYWTYPARLEDSSSTTTQGGAGAAPQTNNINKERGKFVGDPLDASALHAVYKAIESDYHEKAFGGGSGAAASRPQWNMLVQKEDVEVAMMEIPSDPTCPYVRMSAIIPTPVQDCWEFLQLAHWDDNIPLIDPFYEGVSFHGTFVHRGTHMILARKRTKRLLGAFGKRDFVFLSVADTTKPSLPDGTWVSGTVSVHTPQIPRQLGYTRAYQDSIAFYKPLDKNTKTQLTIVFRMDLNDSSSLSAADNDDEAGGAGWLPMWLYVKTIGTTGNRSIHTLRTVLVEAHERKIRALLALKKQAAPGRRKATTMKGNHLHTNSSNNNNKQKRSWMTRRKNKEVDSDLSERVDTLDTRLRRIRRWMMPWLRNHRHEKK
jgi:hypothetical protein